MHHTFATAGLVALAFAAPLTAAQSAVQPLVPFAADPFGAMVEPGTVGAIGSVGTGYCRPYPTDPTLVTYAYCFGQGTGNAAETFANHVLDGNVTNYREAREKADEFEDAVLACQRDPGNVTCPTEALAAVA